MSRRGGEAEGAGVGMSVTGEVDGDETALEGQGHGVKGVSVLRPAMHEEEFG